MVNKGTVFVAINIYSAIGVPKYFIINKYNI